MNRHTRYRPATTTRNTATQWSRRSFIAKGSVESTHKVPTSHYDLLRHETLLRNAKGSVESTHNSFIAKGSVESTHKVPTSHYHAKHRTDGRCHRGRVARWTNTPARISLRKGQLNRHTRYRPASFIHSQHTNTYNRKLVHTSPFFLI